MSDTGLPPDLPGPAQPNYGAQSPVPPPRSAPPQYTPSPAPVYAPPPAKPGMSTGAKVGIVGGIGCLALIVIAIIVVMMIGFFSMITSSSDSYSPPIFEDDDSSNGNTIGSVESQWKSGVDWLEPPAGETQPTAFLPGYDNPEDWLYYQMGVSSSFTVVFTSDPTYNCGMAKADPQPDWVIGCYNPDYGDTIFLWWGAQASDDMKALILLHEYSHYYQNWQYFDATRSAADAGLFDDPAFVQDVWETDATCRVYDDWHYTTLEYLDSHTVSPCGDTGWGPHWFENELLERGVRVTDY